MKRVVLSIIAVAAALVTVSCNKEQAFDSGDIAKVTYTVAGPQMVATKAMGTIGSAYTLFYEVRLWDGENLGNKLTGTGLSGSKTVGAAEWPATVQFDLARGKQYKILFWAQSASAPEDLFDASNLTAIAIDHTAMAANNEDCDAFSGFDVITPSGATAASATLHRPFALVNLGTSDAAQFMTASGNAEVGNVKVTVTGSLANSFNVATATAGAGVETSFESTAAKIDAYDAKTLTVNEADFNYLSAVYVLPPAGEGIVNVAYEIKDNAANAITNLTVTNVPVKTNYRTNITGKLLTGSTTYNISVDQAFAGNTNKAVGPTFASIAALNEYFETLLDNADNGNIDPETVTLTAVGTLPTGMETPTIYLPKVTENIQILMPVNDPALDLVISYADGATDAQKPANLYFYASNIKTLTADITSTHFELISGSIVNTEAVVSTSTGTFVIQQGARVGTATIMRGNAVIAGAVETVYVDDDATADGTAPVQVFLEKESSVEEILLYAKTDVVVEQPADQIEVENTEYKVAVYVYTNDCSATAQNGGQIYIELGEGVTSCTVAADGKSNAEVGEGTPSSVKIASVKAEGATIDASTSGGGAIYNETNAPVTYYVAQIGETKYTTIEAAVAAVLDGETIIVLSDIHQDAGILFDKENVSAKLNLNNKTITIDSGSNINNRAIRIDNGALEVYGGSIIAVGAGTTSANGTGCYGAFRVEANGALDAHDLNLKNSRPWGLNVKVLGGTATLTNVNITSSYGGGIEVTEADLGTNSKIGTATLNNCNFTQTGYFDHCSSTLSVSGGSELTINSGTYKSENWALYVFSSGGVITVNGGTFSGNKDGKAIEAAIDTQSYPNYEGGLKLKGGSFFGGFSITLPAYMEVTGGSFSVNPSEYVTEGYAAIAIDEDPYHFKVVPVDTYEIEVKNLEELQAAIGLKFKNIKYVGSEPIDASFTVAPSVATTVKNLNVAYSSTSSSDPAMTINGPMILKNAQISSKSRCTLEIAEGQTSTLDGCTISNSGYGQSDARAININGGTVVSISGCVFSVSNPRAYTRGLNVLGDGANITVVNSTITAGEYAINLPNTTVNTTISVTESTINGWAIYNVWKDNNTIEFTECTLNSLNDKDYSAEGWNNFGAFKYNNDTLNDVIIVTDCVINVESTTGNKQYLSFIGGTGHQLKLKGQTVITGTNTNTGQYMVALSQTGATCDIDDDESVEVHWNE